MLRCFEAGRFGFRGGFGGIQFITMFLILIVLILAVYLVYKSLSRYLNLNNFSFSSAKAIEILNERFAKGEISEEEYLSKKKLILDKKA